MVAAAPKRGNQLTLWDDGEECVAPEPAPVPVAVRRRRKRVATPQLTFDAIDLNAPDPEAWLEANGGLCVPQSAVDAVGQQFRADLEARRDTTGRVFEDKDGWHLLGDWVRENEKGIWAVAHKIVNNGLATDTDDVFSELCRMCLSWARWVRPWVERKGKRVGARFLTVVQTFGVRKYQKERPYKVLAAQFAEEYQETSVSAKAVRDTDELAAADEMERVLSVMRPFERHMVSEHYLHGVTLRELADRMGRRVKHVAALIQSGLQRARRALAEGGGA